VLDPREGIAHRPGRERGTPDPAVTLNGSEPGALEHAYVLGHRRQRHVEARGELADRGVPRRQPREDLAAGAVGESEERGI
jgi:hypothetical protein